MELDIVIILKYWQIALNLRCKKTKVIQLFEKGLLYVKEHIEIITQE
jgi:hypothetical protein